MAILSGLERHDPSIAITMRDGDDGDVRLSLATKLAGFEYHDVSKGADKCIIRLENVDMEFFDNPFLRRGNKLDVAWGYGATMARTRSVIVKKITGGTLLTVEAHHDGVELDKEAKCRAFEDMTRSAVVKQILRENGYSTSDLFVQETPDVFEVINQLGETDAQMLQRLAVKEGLVFWFSPDGVHWEEERLNDPPTRVFTYYTDQSAGDIINFSVKSDLSRMAGEVSVASKNPDSKKDTLGKGSDGDTERPVLTKELAMIDVATGERRTVTKRIARKVVRPSSARDAKTAKKEADARFKAASRRNFELTLNCVGDPEVEATQVIEVRGLGRYLSGKWYVKEAKHRIVGGYGMDLVCRRSGTDANPGGDGDQTKKGKQNTSAATKGDELFKRVEESTGVSTYTRRPKK